MGVLEADRTRRSRSAAALHRWHDIDGHDGRWPRGVAFLFRPWKHRICSEHVLISINNFCSDDVLLSGAALMLEVYSMIRSATP